ncbi:MAG: tryptophan 2,3-dioxygenase family protein [Alphaproteobacteria bacterium]
MHYADYLRLHELLDLQRRESERQGSPAHDEMLFIIIHQAYELWFKQILFELDLVQEIFSGPVVEDTDTGKIVHALDRVLAIQKLLVQQVDILETMTPMDFLEFRDLLMPASGFQSVQFRELEIRLGLERDERLSVDGGAFDVRLKPEEREYLARIEKRPSLLGQLDRWLARTPFVDMKDFDFERAYTSALHDMLAAEHALIESNEYLTTEERERQLASLDRARNMLDALFDEARYRELQERGAWRLSRPALKAALFIHLYRDEPALQLPFRMLSLLMDIDEAMSTWRLRHALMAQRMIGRKVGTGGSSGHGYLRETADRHRVFEDLFSIATFLIPRSSLPRLPEGVHKAMSYRYASTAGR